MFDFNLFGQILLIFVGLDMDFEIISLKCSFRSNYDALHSALNRHRNMDASREDGDQPRPHHQQQQQHHHHQHNNDDWGGSYKNNRQNNSWEDDNNARRHHQQRDRWTDNDNDNGGGGGSWRWNETNGGGRNQDSATRRDLMPGHVHVLGILRHSRSRREGEHQREHDPDDDCLGSHAPLMNPTGDPLLDARLEREQAELASRSVSQSIEI